MTNSVTYELKNPITTLKVKNPIDLESFRKYWIETDDENNMHFDIIDLSECQYFCSAFLGWLIDLKHNKKSNIQIIPTMSQALNSLLLESGLLN